MPLAEGGRGVKERWMAGTPFSDLMGIKVLERITVDKENSLAREIDELRDR